MSFDSLVVQADKNGGSASMVVGFNFLSQSRKHCLPSKQSSPPVSQPQSNTTFSQPQLGMIHSQRAAPMNPLHELEWANRCFNEAKEYKKNAEESERKKRISQKQWSLSGAQIIPIQNIQLDSFIPYIKSHCIANTAYYLSGLTGLNALGIMYAILASVSIATWGRINIKLTDTWSEPAVDMIIQVSSAGTKKSSLTKHLRAPFNLFCSEANEMFEELSKNAKEKKRLASKATGSRSRKIIEAALKECATMEQKDELDFLQRAIDEAAQFNCNLAQSVEITPPVQILVDKCTSFQLAAALSEQGECQGCITAEGNMIASRMLCSPEDAYLFLRGHTQEPYVYENARKKINLAHPALPMINLVQPVVASKLYANEFLNENGVTARFVPYFHQGSILAPYGFNMGDGLAAYNSKIKSLLHLYHTQDKNAPRYEVGVTPDALELVKNFEKHIRYNEIPIMPEAAAPCMLKAHGQAVRFAWDIHAWNTDQPHLHPINAEEIQTAITLVRASFSHIKYAYSPLGLAAYSVARKILESLGNVTDFWEQNKLIADGIDSTTLQQRIGCKSKEVNNALRLLETYNYLAVYDDATNNLKVALHPNFYDCVN
ncbi:MAG: DUF3987 domain-containing protein [Desulfovibrio sp.]|uniref:DUF3987 domain-containing protein n=1 Tax=Desulfovibrio sp. TaxID=885 RepID=UPI00135D97E9|nr:DUF3987 domain-containing protein [Desulfovibrio sp.]MTJ92341.1 DUF3987 domain-containing protein [Desulfovibrio sp.]